MENEVGKLTEKETQKKYYFIDNGLLNLFLMNSETSLLENMVAVELCRRFGKENVFFLNAEKEIDFIVFWFLGEQMLLVVLGNNSGLFWAKNKHQVPYKKQKAIRSNKKDVLYDLMTVLGEFVAVWRYIPQLKQFVYAENFNVFHVVNLKKVYICIAINLKKVYDAEVKYLKKV